MGPDVDRAVLVPFAAGYNGGRGGGEGSGSLLKSPPNQLLPPGVVAMQFNQCDALE